MSIRKKAFRYFVTIFIVYGLLVATHEGEFWPFSIYPMFSQAGKEWTRSMVRDVSDVENDSLLQKVFYQVSDLPGQTFAMNEIGINQNDVSNFIEKNQEWDETKLNAMRKLFEGELQNKTLLIYKVKGKLAGAEKDSVTVSYSPFIKIQQDQSIVIPANIEK